MEHIPGHPYLDVPNTAPRGGLPQKVRELEAQLKAVQEENRSMRDVLALARSAIKGGAAEDVKVQCDLLFQAGGPRVYLLHTDGILRPSQMSFMQTLFFAETGESVFHRGKLGNRYVWKQTVKGAE